MFNRLASWVIFTSQISEYKHRSYTMMTCNGNLFETIT